MTVLIVEDNAKMRLMIRRIIENNVQSIESICECDDGIEAVKLYHKMKPDWVVMDIRLKLLDGLSATQQIIKSDPTAKIIIITQYDDPAYRERAKSIGAYDHVLKENIFDILKIINEKAINSDQ